MKVTAIQRDSTTIQFTDLEIVTLIGILEIVTLIGILGEYKSCCDVSELHKKLCDVDIILSEDTP